MRIANRVEKACGIFLLWTVATTAAPAQTKAIATPAQTTATAPTVTFTKLYDFVCTQGGDCPNGANPESGLVQSLDGKLYGTTQYGGANISPGTVFKITPAGALTTLHSFNETDGDGPQFAALIQDADGNFYGETYTGGANGGGTVFKITASGTLTTLYRFCSQSNCADGAIPIGGVVQGTDGNFYGTTSLGGSGRTICVRESGLHCGTVFKITPGGALTTLYSFCPQGRDNCKDGAEPVAGLVQGTDGNFYGTTEFGGNSIGGCENASCGTVFKITPSGTLTTLHRFDGTDGGTPVAGLVQASDGNFYGTTWLGGNQNEGTVFKITPGGKLISLYSFCSQGGRNCTDGTSPQAALVQGTDGRLYGTTQAGGAGRGGTIFEITPSEGLTTLHTFDGVDGAGSITPLVQDTDGKFYGTTRDGGATFDGNVFRLSVGSNPFVEALPAYGNMGAAVKILGTDLTGATSVTFNGTEATFIVKAQSYIETTVPTGATTGTVQVVTPGGTLSSNVPFQVLP